MQNGLELAWLTVKIFNSVNFLRKRFSVELFSAVVFVFVVVVSTIHIWIHLVFDYFHAVAKTIRRLFSRMWKNLSNLILTTAFSSFQFFSHSSPLSPSLPSHRSFLCLSNILETALSLDLSFRLYHNVILSSQSPLFYCCTACHCTQTHTQSSNKNNKNDWKSTLHWIYMDAPKHVHCRRRRCWWINSNFFHHYTDFKRFFLSSFSQIVNLARADRHYAEIKAIKT